VAVWQNWARDSGTDDDDDGGTARIGVYRRDASSAGLSPA
jgi:hypothetical protein